MDRQTITVDIAPGNSQVERLGSSQGDIGRPMGVYIIQNGVALDCSAYSAELYIIKPDGKFYTTQATVDSTVTNLIKWETALQETPVAGSCAAQIRIAAGDDDIGTARFVEFVEASPGDMGSASESEVALLTEYVRQARESAESAGRDATTASGAASSASGSASTATTAANTAMQAATAATAAADRAEAVEESIPADYTQLSDDVTGLKSAIGDYQKYIIGVPDLMPSVTNEYYLDDSGVPTSYSGFYYTDFIPVTPGKEYKILYTSSTTTNPLRVHGYNSEQTWVEMLKKLNVGGGGNDVVDSQTVTIPAGISFIRISTYGNKPLQSIYQVGTNDINGRIDNKLDSKVLTEIDFSAYDNGYIKPDGSIVISGNWKHKTISNVKKGTVIIASVYCSDSLRAIMLFDNEGFVEGTEIQASGTHTFTITTSKTGTVYINFSASYSASGTTLFAYDIDGMMQEIDDLETDTEIPYMSMFHKIGICGDSLSSGEIYNGSAMRDCYKYSWLANIAHSIDAEYVHYSKGGLTSKAWWNDASGYKTALANETEKPSAYYVAFGTNDKNQSEYGIGTISDVAGTDSFVGYMRAIIEYIHTNQPNAVVFLVSTYNTSDASTPYNEMISDITDLYNYCYFIDYANHGTVFTTQSSIFVENSHFSTLGYIKVATTIKKLTETIMKNNLTAFKYFGLDNYSV